MDRAFVELLLKHLTNGVKLCFESDYSNNIRITLAKPNGDRQLIDCTSEEHWQTRSAKFSRRQLLTAPEIVAASIEDLSEEFL